MADHGNDEDVSATYDLDRTERDIITALRGPVAVNPRTFDAQVMNVVRDVAQFTPPSRRSNWYRTGALVAAGAALAAAAVLMTSARSASRAAPARSNVAAAPAVRTVTFTLVTPGASKVAIAGSFNGWNISATPMRRVDSDTWAAEIPLGAGRYVYQFVIDGHRWIADPRAQRDAGGDFGTRNSVLTVPIPGSA